MLWFATNTIKMKNIPCLILAFILFLGTSQNANAQTYGQIHSIQVNATPDANNTEITLDWNVYSAVSSIDIYRKTGSSSWGTAIATLSGSTTSYTDNNVSSNQLYEYKLVGTRATTYDAFGYITTGIEIAEITDRGLLVMIIDSKLDDSLQTEIDQYRHDLLGDGYDFLLKEFDTSSTAQALKDTIQSLNNNNSNLSTIFLVGALPYYYTGAMSPDGHSNHHGAWPSDMIYADVDGSYSDAIINYTNTTDQRHTNATSDTKSDQSYLASDVDLQIGRLDLSRLTNFSQSETALYQNYFSKLHDFKTGVFKPRNRAVIDDNFASFAEGFSQNGYRNFSPLTSNDSVLVTDAITAVDNSSALWTFACGGGSFTSINGFTSSSQLASKDLDGAFALVMGSYNADPDQDNNLLRSMLANGNYLSAGWAGRPNWFMHHMGMGINIGYSAQISQNNTSSEYEPTGFYAQMMHIILHGDPSLKNHYTPNTSSLGTIRTQNKDTAILNWSAVSGIDGYNVYRSTEEFGDYIKVNTSLVDTNHYMDPISDDTSYFYRIESYELVENSAGSYYESSVGEVIESDKNAAPLPVTLIRFKANKQDDVIALDWTVADEIDFSHYELEKLDEATGEWTMHSEIAARGDAHSITQYEQIDNQPNFGRNVYRLKMVDYDGSFEYSKLEIVEFHLGMQAGEFQISPTLVNDYLKVNSEELKRNLSKEYTISDISGNVLDRIVLNGSNQRVELSDLPSGIYFISDSDYQGKTRKFIKN